MLSTCPYGSNTLRSCPIRSFPLPDERRCRRAGALASLAAGRAVTASGFIYSPPPALAECEDDVCAPGLSGVPGVIGDSPLL